MILLFQMKTMNMKMIIIKYYLLPKSKNDYY